VALGPSGVVAARPGVEVQWGVAVFGYRHLLYWRVWRRTAPPAQPIGTWHVAA
jgi:hypothetical protein